LKPAFCTGSFVQDPAHGAREMKLEYVPLLRIQRDLYDIPRGFTRFREYLRTMTGDDGELKLPLVAMNPMGKDHLPSFLDHLLAIDGDGVAARALEEAASTLVHEPGAYRAGLVVADDLKGGWTNRYAYEYSYRFEQRAYYRRAWLVATLWTSEVYDTAMIRAELLQCVYRAVHVQRQGPPRTLSEMLAQETYAIRNSGASDPHLEDDDLDYTRTVLAEYMSATDRATVMAALFGDAAARDLGYPPLGLSPRAGLALAAAGL
jgi:hypothetical protein